MLLLGLQYSARVLLLSISFPDKRSRWLSVAMLVASATLFLSSATVILLGTCSQGGHVQVISYGKMRLPGHDDIPLLM
jgi:hypothetical protein